MSGIKLNLAPKITNEFVSDCFFNVNNIDYLVNSGSALDIGKYNRRNGENYPEKTLFSKEFYHKTS